MGDPINAAEELDAYDGNATVERIVRNSGSVVLCPSGLKNLFEDWADEPSSPCSVGQAVNECGTATSGRHFLTVGFQLDETQRAALEAKGYVVTTHTPTPTFGGPGGVLMQSDIPIFDDELTL